MNSLNEQINTFYKKNSALFKKPLEKIINNFLETCKYKNNESLERHNFGSLPVKLNLKNKPSDFDIDNIEKWLIDELNNDDNNYSDNSIIELLWGDIQLGKRIQACVIMWISIFILKRPVLYIFRNLGVDQIQLEQDISDTNEYSFNIQFIQKICLEFNDEMQKGIHNEAYEPIDSSDWVDYFLPDLVRINNVNINFLANKEKMKSPKIYCCLMNHTQLKKINDKFSEYIYNNDELVNITVLVDESDIHCPTGTNDKNSQNTERDIRDSTLVEKHLAKLYCKVRYVLHITGTSHSLLYNVTTCLRDDTDIILKISKVHKMKRSDNYYGLFNDKIIFNTNITEWWNTISSNSIKKKYDIVEDYNLNIKKIITEIIDRKHTKYNSLLISEEKIRVNQFELKDKILYDFANLFIIVYHGNCLHLYFPKIYTDELLKWSKWDSQQFTTSQRLNQIGGIYDNPEDTEKSKKLLNNYVFYEIDYTKFNIKMIYKLIAILFKKSTIQIKNKVLITITGKYGERGYSFTSDDYGEYSFHLTDQYFVSHASLNCTDISQRLRLQGKYNDISNNNLTLWTSNKVKTLIQSYICWIKMIEQHIMSCTSWDDIKELIENIIISNEFDYYDLIKHLDTRKKSKSINRARLFDKKRNGYCLLNIANKTEYEINEILTKKIVCNIQLPQFNEDNVINKINTVSKSFFKEEYGIYTKKIIKLSIPDTIDISNTIELTNFINSNNNLNLSHIRVRKYTREKYTIKNNKKYYIDTLQKKYNSNQSIDIELKINKGILHFSCENIKGYDFFKKNTAFLVYGTDIKTFPIKNNKFDIVNQQFSNGNMYQEFDDNIKYSEIKEKYDNNNPNYILSPSQDYYWITPNDLLYLHLDKYVDMLKMQIKNTISINNISNNNQIHTYIDNTVDSFINKCCKIPEQQNLRIGIKNVYTYYTEWAHLNNIYPLNLKNFKLNFNKKFNIEKSKGQDINGKNSVKGYHLIITNII
jgi:hypothetical protein